MAENRRLARAAKPRSPKNHVFVDFENVPAVDLALIGDEAVEVTLLIGEKQRRLDLGLVQQIHEHAAKVVLVEVGSSGRNALDLVLAWHLGKTVDRHPGDSFFIISKDKDFDPLIVHLCARGISVVRLGSFLALPFLSGSRNERGLTIPRPALVVKGVSPAGDGGAGLLPNSGSEPVENVRLGKLIDRLKHKTKARPVRRKRLLSYINGFYANQLSEPEQEALVVTLEQRGIVTLDLHGRVGYPDAEPDGAP